MRQSASVSDKSNFQFIISTKSPRNKNEDSMTSEEIKTLKERQKSFFLSGKTLSVSFRKMHLKKLYNGIKIHQKEITDALTADLGKHETEGFMCEVGLVLSEITFMLKNLKKLARDKRVFTGISHFPAKSFVRPSPYGCVLIMSPWNYPFLLSIEPLVDALAAGNTVILKPSAFSKKTTEVISSLLREIFSEEYVAVVTGGRAENTSLLNEKFDRIFFTGSKTVGKEVLRHAAEFLTPVTLELGGKSPCIVDSSAKIKTAAKRIVWGKFLNCGQTCVAPDYILCHASVKDSLLNAIKEEIKNQFGEDPLQNKNYGKIINEKHFERISSLLNGDKIFTGGKTNSRTLQIEPTVMDNVTFDDEVMQEEIFGPVLPVIQFEDFEEVFKLMNELPKPLALYVFSENKRLADEVISRCGFGGGCINDCIMHLATNKMGFGGFSESGMGAYHGKTGFETFSHKKSIVDRKTWTDIPLRNQPWTAFKQKLFEFILK